MIDAPLKPQQLAFPSLAFDKERTVLYVGEFAARCRISEEHVIDLIEEGKLAAFNIAGRHEYLRVPAAVVDALAQKFGVPRETIVEVMKSAPATPTTRAHWRIPVKEGFETFLRENHS